VITGGADRRHENVAMNGFKRTIVSVVLLVVMTVLTGVCVLFVQGKQKPDTNARYVAIGSSFAAGLGLGERAPGGPFACQRSVNGYPQQLARLKGLSFADVTCSGATVKNVLRHGQFFQSPQIDAVGPNTELVTITVGGNDIDYVGDLVMMSYRKRGGIVGLLIDRFWQGSKSMAERPFTQLQSDLIATPHEVAKRSPRARIVVVTYPAILPATGTCAQIGIGETEAALMKEVGARLVEVTRAAAQSTNATLVNIAALSAGHDACSSNPWVNGAAPEHGAPFHPTLAGAKATARQILVMLDEKP
jgi:lysophospholipase L1-like esterase